MRGLCVEAGGSLYYADCYNASPTSMKDALAHFLKISAGSEPRLFLLGSMAELGLAAHRHHKEIGFNLPYRAGDRAVLVGENAETYKLGMVESQWPEDAIEIFADSPSAKDSVAAFKGSVFAKGSRVCELENALPAAALAALDSEGARRIEPEPEPEPEEPEPPEEDDNAGADEFEDAEDFEDGEDSDVESADGNEDDEDERETI